MEKIDVSLTENEQKDLDSFVAANLRLGANMDNIEVKISWMKGGRLVQVYGPDYRNEMLTSNEEYENSKKG